MKYLLFILLLTTTWTDPAKIAKVNELKKKAKTAYLAGDYKTALSHYRYLSDSLQLEDDNITLNMANAYYQLNDSIAINQYQSLTTSANNKVRSLAEQQLGVMANKSKKYEEALSHFKQALRADPTNEEARYNYELLKKVLEEQKQNQDKNQQNKDDKNKDEQKDQEKKDEENKKGDNQEQQDKDGDKDGEKKEDQQEKSQEQKDKEGKEGEKKEEEQKQDGKKSEEQKKKDAEEKEQQQNGEEQKSEEQRKKEQEQALSQKLKEMKISKEKAQMILEAMKNNEIQYIQQSKKKAKNRPDNDKPDW